MEHAHTPLRPGMTALAAALALTATPLFAQAADPAPSEAAPVMVSPPPPVMSTAPAATTVTPSAMTAAPAPSAPTPTMEPIVHQPDPADAVAAATPRATRTASPRTATPVTTPTPRATATPATAVTRAPATTEPMAPVIAAPVAAVAAPTAATKTAPAPQTAAQTSDDTLPIAGGVGAAILLLAGGAFAFSRRRRDDDEEVVYDTTPETLVTPAPFVAPVVPAPVVPMAAARASDSSTALPSGFDISRFGRHTQAAYRGPTPENPSVSLKKRLKIASFYDGRERMAAEGRAVPATPTAAVAATAATVQATPTKPSRTSDHITVRAPRARPSFKPVFSS